MRVWVFYALVAGWIAWVFAVDRYSARGIRAAQEECEGRGILRIVDQSLWRRVNSDPTFRAQARVVVRDERPDSRFYRSVYTLYAKRQPVAELNMLRAYEVSSLVWLGFEPQSPTFVCAADVRGSELARVGPLFFK
jgi:hypothetical protein